MNPHVFRAYDVRGVADVDLPDAFVRDLGRAYGTVIVRDGGGTICLGRDCRLHSDRLHAALVAGLLSTGLEVIDIGVVSSPLLYFAVHTLDSDGGVQITGSHNPPEHNGFKLMRGKGPLFGEAIQELRSLIERRDFTVGEGELRHEPILDAYVDHVAGSLELGPHPVKVVVDGGNGTGGPVALALFQRLGVEVVPLFAEMDGAFPNHHPDPTVEANLVDLRRTVRDTGADVGVAFDGDADRLGVIDAAGRVYWGDRLMVLFARDVLSRNPGAAIIGEVKCSKVLYEQIAKHGGRPVMSAVGHSIIKQRMKQEGALLAGEMSGHLFFGERWFGFDDAVYAAARLLEILTRSPAGLPELFADVPETCVTPELRLPCPDDRKFSTVERALEHFRAAPDANEVIDVDGARVDFGDGWGLIRASNTQPVIVLRAEADTPQALARIRERLERFVADQAS